MTSTPPESAPTAPSSPALTPLSALRWVLERRLTRTMLLLALVVLIPALLHGYAWIVHATSYTGTCGPHAPDIAAHPCTQEQYDAEFNAGFEGMALFMGEAMLGFGVLVVGSISWMAIDNRVQYRRLRVISE